MLRISVFLLAFSSTVVFVYSDQIVAGAFQKIFPYATVAKVKTLTTNVNKAAAKAKAKTVVKNWVPKNWKDASAKVVASNPLSKQAYAQNKALTFIDSRYSLKKYINYLSAQAVSGKYLTKAEATKMTKLFWEADAKSLNNFTLTCQTFISDSATQLNKTPPLPTTVKTLSEKFAAANPTDYANLGWTL